MSDWGQGTSNNNIGWGQGSSNNTIDWGSVYADSYAGLTDIGGATPQQIIIDAFKTRVSNDSGTFEAESCLLTQIESLL